MTSPFDFLWNTIIQEQKANSNIILPMNDNEAAKKVLELLAQNSSSTLKEDLQTRGRICKNPELADQAAKAAFDASESENFFEALDRYNDAIRYCPCDSEKISTLFKRRSEILLKLNETQAADVDIERSIGKISDERQTSTQEKQLDPNKKSGRGRRNERKGRPNQNSRPQEEHKSVIDSGREKIPSLTPGPHSHLRCASQYVGLKSDPDRGRHLVAAKEIAAGAVVIVEPAYVCSPLPSYFTSNCSFCCSPMLSPVGCSQCANVMFCNESCREQCLRDFHTAECPILQHLIQGKELTPMALLVYRTIAKGSKLGAAVTELHSLRLDAEFQRLQENSTQQIYSDVYNSDYRAVFYQVTNADSRHVTDRLKRAVTAAYLTECLNAALTLTMQSSQDENALLNDNYKILLTSAFLHHLHSSSCNAYQVTQQDVPGGDIRQSEGLDVGGAIFPTVALLNHSCTPNVARHTHGSTCIVRSTRRIEAGEEILDNYGPHFLSDDDVNKRRRFLRLHYFFECDCEACNGKWPSAVVLRTVPAKILCGGCRGILGAASGPDDLRSLQKCSQCRKKNNFSKLMISWREFENALPSLLKGDYEKALTFSLRLLNVLKTYVLSPSNLQARATQVATLSWSLQGNRRNRP